MPAAEPLRAAQAAGARPAPGGSVVTLRGLSHGYGAAPVIRGLDLRVEAGEFVSIVGQSGCGKSTLLRLIAGLDRPDAGRAELDGLPAGEATDRLRIMFQEPRLLPWSSVAGNVAIGLRHGPDPEAVATALDQVQLGEKAGAWPARLSGGQRQRVALARALVSHPRLLLLDEPLGALDALTRLAMQRLIGQMQRDAGFTAVLVTHDVAEAVSLSDRVIVLGDGRICAQIAVPPAITPAQRAALENRTLAAIFGETPAPPRG